MILEPGVRVLIAHRRLYEGDHMRFFTGVVEGYEAGIARVTGHTWLRDGYSGAFKRKDDTRTKIVSLMSGTLIVYQLPSTIDLASLRVESRNADVHLVDRAGFRMDLTEGVLHGGSQLADRYAS